MAADWRQHLQRWRDAGAVDEATAARIIAWESQRPAASASAGTSRLAAFAFGLGGLLLVAGALLFVSAHWDRIGPAARFGLVLALVAAFHLAGAASAQRSPALAGALHAVGTGALGAGIFLCGQIFNLAEHWPAALLLWSLGAAAAWGLLRDWPQLLWLAVLVPAWLLGEWDAAADTLRLARLQVLAPLTGVWLLAWSYFAAPAPERDSMARRVLGRLGAGLLIPAGAAVAFASEWAVQPGLREAPSVSFYAITWLVAIAVPAAVAIFMQARRAFWLFLPLAWALLFAAIEPRGDVESLLRQALCALAAVGLVAWGVAWRRAAAVNLGVTAFSLTLLWFYFSNLYDKFGRALGLIGMGLLFLVGGMLLERARRRLVARIGGAAR